MTLKVGLVGARGVGALKCFRAMEATDVSQKLWYQRVNDGKCR